MPELLVTQCHKTWLDTPGFFARGLSHWECLEYELTLNGLRVIKEKPMPIIYKEVKLDHGYRLDLLVERKLVIELKTVEYFTNVHFAQLLTYLRLGNYPIGLLINFDVKVLKDGLKRVINT